MLQTTYADTNNITFDSPYPIALSRNAKLTHLQVIGGEHVARIRYDELVQRNYDGHATRAAEAELECYVAGAEVAGDNAVDSAGTCGYFVVHGVRRNMFNVLLSRTAERIVLEETRNEESLSSSISMQVS